ncbi:MarR family transcriptional regulator [Curtobacterium poinsettiae]|uniref:MarR family transcriptional regulator n=1 Tax=Curtobacterium poinsettiae TaxID=159612 RepID=A0ABT3S3F3_9MICO|nr:MarR family transcriptional regulator [Curtobacterium flaccumfaciens]MBT1610915.1 MarR family transcriptional regulator [Curtobacterium flaccumfaciens pv. poinsettiae]MCX2849186.1 MarR family transcriptional regulator [Curtobacterium flaccumfaciens pv. poinsettiae]UXN20093.1 MarR family transcriptional regulator [Curtobacterium flaccumfaciens pv. poinsettiae]
MSTDLAPLPGIDAPDDRAGRAARLREYFAALVRHETDVWNAVEKRMRGEGVLSLARLEVLRIVQAAPSGARVQDVATGVGTSIAAASRLLDRLAADGFLERSTDPDDRRSVRSVLSPQGRDAFALADERFDQALDAVLSDADAAAISDGIAALERLQSKLEARR